MITKITILSLMIAMTGCVSNSNNEWADAQELTTNALDKNELLRLFPGSTVYLNGTDSVQVGFYSENNTMMGKVWGSLQNYIDEGDWMISDTGQFCNQWTGLWSNGEGKNCYSVYPGNDDDQYLMVSGSAENANALKTDVKVITITPAGRDEFE